MGHRLLGWLLQPVYLCLVCLCLGGSLAIADDAVKPEELFHNPIDGRTYHAPGGWITHFPQGGGAKHDSGPVSMFIRLLSSEDDLRRAIDVGELGLFAKAGAEAAEEIFRNSRQQSKILVQFDCYKDRNQIRMVYQGTPEPGLLHAYHSRMSRLPALPLRSEPITFQIEISIEPARRAE